jgi:hypothetical protein
VAEHPEPAEAAEFAELRAGQDYIADPATLQEVDPDALLEPALH